MLGKVIFRASALISVIILFAVYFPTPAVFAYPTPTAPADTYYIEDNWADIISFNGQNVLRAYRIGYNADAGSYSRIILAFGRQDHGAQGWGVDLPRQYGYHPNSWVKDIAEAYMQGYSDGHTVTSEIVIGTSNYNPSWTCDNANASTLHSYWAISGTVWNNLHSSLVIPANYVIPVSGNDIEDWKISGEPWISCGLGAVAWLEAYNNAALSNLSNTVYRDNINFGNTAFINAGSGYWTAAQQYRVSYGLQTALVAPQIYCDGNEAGWVTLRMTYAYRFRGVVSDNASSNICNNSTPTLNWEEAWDALNNALTIASYPDHVAQFSSAFCYNAPGQPDPCP